MKDIERISIIIPTYKHPDRDSDLLNLINSLLKESNIKFIGEIIIVDNGNSLSVSRSNFFDERIKIISEPKIGLNYARNTGIHHAKYNIVSFLDDDIVISSSWAKNIVKGYSRHDILCVGGPVLINNREQKYPKWLSDYFLRFLLPPKFPNESGIIKPPYYLIGANMSFQKNVFELFGFFDLNLDRKGKNLLSNGDIEFIMRIPVNKVWYEAGAVVYENIPKHRITRRFMIRRLFWQGISDFIMVKRNGIDRFYDKNEIKLTANFFKSLISSLLRYKFLESFCMIVRKLGFSYGGVYLKINQETDVTSIP